jgi:predicted DNA-binding transcriptional regulator YafY
MISKFTGRRVEIIYQDADGHLTQRTIRVLGVQDVVVRAYCLTTGAPRTFRVDGILACMPVSAGRRSA